MNLLVLILMAWPSAADQKFVSLANAIACEPTSGQRPFQPQAVYEVYRFGQAKIAEPPNDLTLEQSLHLILDSYSHFAPLRGQRFSDEISEILRATDQPAPQDLAIGGAWVPIGCAIAPVIFQSASGEYFLDGSIWQQLSAYQQAILLLQASAVKEAAKAGGSALDARLFIRFLLANEIKSREKTMEASVKLGPSASLEYAFQNGDVALIDGRAHREFKFDPNQISGCGYKMVAGPAANYCPDGADPNNKSLSRRTFKISGEGNERVLRIGPPNSYSGPPDYLVSPRSLGLPDGTTDYIFQQWEVHGWGDDGLFHIISSLGIPYKNRFVELTCAATNPVIYSITSLEQKLYRLSLSGAKLSRCTPEGPVRFNVDGRDLVLPAEFYGSSIANDGPSFRVRGMVQKANVVIGKYSFSIQDGDLIYPVPSSGIRIEFSGYERPYVKMQISGSTCELKPKQLQTTSSEKRLSATLKSNCSVKTNAGPVTLIGDVLIDLTRGIFLSAESDRDISNKIRVLGQTVKAHSVVFDSDGKVLRFDLDGGYESKIHYFNHESNKMVFAEQNFTTQHFDTTYKFCVNYAEKRLEDVTSKFPCTDFESSPKGAYR